MTQEEFKILTAKYEQAKKLVEEISDLKHFLEEVDENFFSIRCYDTEIEIGFVYRFIERYFGREKTVEIFKDILKRRTKIQLELTEQKFAELKFLGKRK